MCGGTGRKEKSHHPSSVTVPDLLSLGWGGSDDRSFPVGRARKAPTPELCCGKLQTRVRGKQEDSGQREPQSEYFSKGTLNTLGWVYINKGFCCTALAGFQNSNAVNEFGCGRVSWNKTPAGCEGTARATPCHFLVPGWGEEGTHGQTSITWCPETERHARVPFTRGFRSRPRLHV